MLNVCLLKDCISLKTLWALGHFSSWEQSFDNEGSLIFLRLFATIRIFYHNLLFWYRVKNLTKIKSTNLLRQKYFKASGRYKKVNKMVQLKNISSHAKVWRWKIANLQLYSDTDYKIAWVVTLES